MYKIIGGDGHEYGPVNLEQLRDWLKQGRINRETRVRTETSTEWQPAASIAELASLFGPAGGRQSGEGAPPVITPPAVAKPQIGLAIVSLVLGLSSLALCLGVITGLPAIIFGHVARRRAVRSPARYAGAGYATTGLVLGYLSIILTLVIAAMLLPAVAQRKRMVQHMVQPPNNCQRNLREIGLAFKIWALDHNDQYPFNVSTNAGGTRELCAAGNDGFDSNAIVHFLVISNELSTPNFLVCPKDSRRHPVLNFEDLRPENVTYRLRTGTNINSDHPQEVLAVCPIHGNELYCDGNVRAAGNARRK